MPETVTIRFQGDTVHIVDPPESGKVSISTEGDKHTITFTPDDYAPEPKFSQMTKAEERFMASLFLAASAAFLLGFFALPMANVFANGRLTTIIVQELSGLSFIVSGGMFAAGLGYASGNRTPKWSHHLGLDRAVLAGARYSLLFTAIIALGAIDRNLYSAPVVHLIVCASTAATIIACRHIYQLLEHLRIRRLSKAKAH